MPHGKNKISMSLIASFIGSSDKRALSSPPSPGSYFIPSYMDCATVGEASAAVINPNQYEVVNPMSRTLDSG